MTDEVEAYMVSLGFFYDDGCDAWQHRSEDNAYVDMAVTSREATFFYNATRKAKVEVLEAVRRGVIGDDDTLYGNYLYPSHPNAEARNVLRAEQRQAIDQLIRENEPNE